MKFKTHNNGGNSLKKFHCLYNLNAEYAQLVELFGRPMLFGETDEYSSSPVELPEWHITFPDGEVAVIYQYRTSPHPTINDLWNVGGTSHEAAGRILRLVYAEEHDPEANESMTLQEVS